MTGRALTCGLGALVGLFLASCAGNDANNAEGFGADVLAEAYGEVLTWDSASPVGCLTT